MIHINLLPVREIKQRIKSKQQIITFIAALVFLLLSLGVFSVLQSNAITKRNDTLADLKKEKQRYAKILREIDQYEKDRKVLEARIGVIKKLKNSSSLTVHALDEIAKITPSKRMWLTSLNQNSGNLSISGMALDNRTIAKYMDELTLSKYIKNVRLASSSLKGFAGRNLKSFSISCSLAAPDEETPEATKKSNK